MNFLRVQNVLLSLLLSGVIIGCVDSPSDVSAPEDIYSSSKIIRLDGNPQIAAGRYIVMLHDGVGDVAGTVADIAAMHKLKVTNVYQYAIKGFAAEVPADRLDMLAADPRVVIIEPDQIMHIAAQAIDWGINAMGANSSSAASGNGGGTVTGVDIYILDTGIDLDHPDLNVNTTASRNYTSDASADDGHGHGTHVAGICAAIDNGSYTVGVAPGATVVAVKVLGNNGSGLNSWVMQGIDYIEGVKLATPSAPIVANMSLGGGGDRLLDIAVNNCVDAGVIMVVAAGNDGFDASRQSPARAVKAITVGAHASNNALASFSNYGRFIDINAPGVSIRSLYKNGGMATASGTSMASPYVAGAAALYVSHAANASSTPQQVRNQLVYDARAVVTSTRPKHTNRSVSVVNY